MGFFTPRSARESRWAQARRDLATVVAGLVGRGPSPLIAVGPRRPKSAKVARPIRTLVVEAVEREAEDVVRVVLRDPSGAPIAFVPGQFITVSAVVDGHAVSRNYSIASSAADARSIVLGVKRVAGGALSPWLTEALRPDDRLEVRGPYGQFTVRPEASRTRALALVAGGIGVTPLLSIAESVLAFEPKSTVALAYGARSPAHVAFRRELERLTRTYGARFRLALVLEEGADDASLAGRLDGARLMHLLDAWALPEGTELFVCGPDAMRDSIVASLRARGVDERRVHSERFALPDAAAPKAGGEAAAVEIALGGARHSVIARPGATLLQAGLAAGLPMPFSCGMGGCGACRVRLVSGAVDEDATSSLTAGEREAGYALACSSRPRGACVIEVEEEGR